LYLKKSPLGDLGVISGNDKYLIKI
jgi:hypothetical protein